MQSNLTEFKESTHKFNKEYVDSLNKAIKTEMGTVLTTVLDKHAAF